MYWKCRLQNVGHTIPGCRLNIKMPSYQHRDSHVKDKTVSPTVLSLTWESPYLGKTVFILRRGPACYFSNLISVDFNWSYLWCVKHRNIYGTGDAIILRRAFLLSSVFLRLKERHTSHATVSVYKERDLSWYVWTTHVIGQTQVRYQNTCHFFFT